MKRSTLVLNTFTNCVLLASFIFAVTVTRSAPLGNTFTYQGRLSDNGQPASGDYGMVFYLYDAPTNGNQLGNLGIVSVPVSNGLFNVTLDFGATFDGNARWLEIAVQTNGAASFTVLSPRQQLTPTPYALTALTATSLTSYGSLPLELTVDGERALLLQSNPNGGPNVIGGASNNVVDIGVAGAVIGGGEVNTIQAGAHDSVIAGGDLHTIQGGASHSTIGGGEHNIIQLLADFSTISGGQNNTVEQYSRDSTIGGGGNNSVQSFADSSTIAGGQGNTVHSNSKESTIVGGFGNEIQTNSMNSTIGGGSGNVLINAARCTITGGLENIISFAAESVIGGGALNSINSGTRDSVISGGIANIIQTNSDNSTIGGGNENSCGGSYATVPGGLSNGAIGNFSFAAGRRAKANHTGAFVWADSTDSDFNSTATNEFAVRATGGARFVSAIDTNGTPISGVTLPAGSGSWSSLSDRSAKTNFAPVNSRELLDRLAQLPVQTWNYRSQDESIRHIGPTAQEFAAAFKVGEDDRHIATVDEGGVALVAIQGLNQKLESRLREQAAQIESLKFKAARVQELEKRLAALEDRLASTPVARSEPR